MEILKISKKDFSSFVDKKITEKESGIFGVVKKGQNYVFDKISSSRELELDYDVTLLPPKKYFQPPKEVLLNFVPNDASSYVAANGSDPMTIIGIHYYDLAAIYMMDRAFFEGEADTHYMKKRENSLLIGLYPTKPYQYRFSKSVVKDQFYKTADLMLVDMGEDYAVEVVSEKGKLFLSGSNAKKNNYSLKKIADAKNKVRDGMKLPISLELSPEFLTRNYRHPAWDYFGSKCFSCGSCVLVCPTCYCFDVREEIDLTLTKGERVRIWDGCMLEDFALVADGHNFREERGSRFRHRMFRKGKYIPEKYRYYGCVGCGRCAAACTAGIAGPVKIFNYILENL